MGTPWAGAWAAEGRSHASRDGEAGQRSRLGTSSATLLAKREHFIHSVGCVGSVKQAVFYNSFHLQTAVAELFITGLFSEVCESHKCWVQEQYLNK